MYLSSLLRYILLVILHPYRLALGRPLTLVPRSFFSYSIFQGPDDWIVQFLCILRGSDVQHSILKKRKENTPYLSTERLDAIECLREFLQNGFEPTDTYMMFFCVCNIIEAARIPLCQDGSSYLRFYCPPPSRRNCLLEGELRRSK